MDGLSFRMGHGAGCAPGRSQRCYGMCNLEERVKKAGWWWLLTSGPMGDVRPRASTEPTELHVGVLSTLLALRASVAQLRLTEHPNRTENPTVGVLVSESLPHQPIKILWLCGIEGMATSTHCSRSSIQKGELAALPPVQALYTSLSCIRRATRALWSRPRLVR